MLFGMDVVVLAIVGLVFFAAAAIAYAMLYGRIANAAATDKRRDRVAGAPAERADARKVDPNIARRKNVQETLKDIELKNKFKASQGTNPPLRLRLQQAGLKTTTTRFYLYSAVSGVFATLFALIGGLSPPFILGFAVIGTLGLPRFVVNYMRKKRQAAFIEELPNAIEVIVRGVKAGLPLNDCMRMIASEAKEPVRSEFRSVMESLTVGIPIDQAVGKMYERMPLAESNFFAIVIAIQSKAGGNLSEALGNLAKVLRERKKMRAKIRAMSQEAKASAGIIGSLPIIVGVLVYLTSPDYITILFVTPGGQAVLVGCVATMGMGIMVMRKMINFDF